MRVIIVGGGIIGAALAYQLDKDGAEVLIIEGRALGSGATAASFGWINASFYLNEHHFRLRQSGIEAWHQFGFGDHLTWQGSLCWDVAEPSLEAQKAAFEVIGYRADLVDRKQIQDLEPLINAPNQALWFQTEGVANPSAVINELLGKARKVKVLQGATVRNLLHDDGQITGVETDMGQFHADRVVLAAGTGVAHCLNTIGIEFPMLTRPGLMLRTRPVPPVLTHVIASANQEVRQDNDGHLWAPLAAHHQADTSSTIGSDVMGLAQDAMDRLKGLLPDVSMDWDRIMQANRPMPQDNLPAIGAIGPDGLFVAVMHSGITLAAISAQLLAPKVLGHSMSNEAADLLAPYDPTRFSA
ncbi:MAG: FAD-dependent oxidoreductase [Paracoccaceae bacterium]